jgi:hypothetical protein
MVFPGHALLRQINHSASPVCARATPTQIVPINAGWISPLRSRKGGAQTAAQPLDRYIPICSNGGIGNAALSTGVTRKRHWWIAGA